MFPGPQCHWPSLIPCPLGLQPFMYGDYIAYDCWLGKVYDLKNQIILKLSNGARYTAHPGGAGHSVGQLPGWGRRAFSQRPVVTGFIKGHDPCCGRAGPCLSGPDLVLSFSFGSWPAPVCGEQCCCLGDLLGADTLF